MYLADMTWDDVRNYLKKEDCLILPVGTCEQHGYHLPLNNDILSVEYFASKLSELTGVMVAPTINYGVNLPCDKLLSGTTGITYDLLRNLILSVTDWWRSQGFKKFILLTFHGDPYHIKALSDLAPDIFVIEAYEIEYQDVLEKQTTMRHACEAETSIALYLYPDKVKMNCVKEYDIPFEKFKEYLYHENTNQPENYTGCLGFPSLATKEKGEILVNRILEYLLSCFNEIKNK